MPEEKTANPFSPSQHLLVLTGHRGTEGKRRQFHIVVAYGKRVRVKNGAFGLLAELARARIETHTGYLCLPAQSDLEVFCLGIHRLRRQIDAVGPEAGMKLVHTGMGSEYCLALKANEIAVDRSFKELPWQLLSADLRDFLIEHCPKVTLGKQHDTAMKVP